MEIHRKVNIHEANSKYMHFSMPNPFNAILTPYPEILNG